MRIAMFTNTYLPHVGGVARSVKTLEDEARKLGHELCIVAPEFDEAEAGRFGHVLRVAAICNFRGSDFSLRLPTPNVIRAAMEEFDPDIIHSHHPFALGDAALREARKNNVPLVFTHHTSYENFTHNLPLDSPALKRITVQLVTGYCNLCNLVIAPSQSVRDTLLQRGVTSRIEVVPTGIDVAFFASGDGPKFRDHLGIPTSARLVGHVGRLTKEKNIPFLAESVKCHLESDPSAVFLVVGDGPARKALDEIFAQEIADGKVFAPGRLGGNDLADAYAAMDVFAFASQNETQGMVLAEAMAAGKPVVALDGPGVREIVRDGQNGFLLPDDADPQSFAHAIARLFDDRELARVCSAGAAATAEEYGQGKLAGKVLAIHEDLHANSGHRGEDVGPWAMLMATLEAEWDLMASRVAAAAAIVDPDEKDSPPDE